MSNPIGWTDQTWNPVTGCTPISPACDHCYAQRMAKRLRGRAGYPDWTLEWSPERGGCRVLRDASFDVTLHPDKLDRPLHWRKPRRIFVVSMGDLFHEDVPDDFLVSVFGAMFLAPQHTYQVLTKRPERMRDFLLNAARWRNKPPENVWLGVTAENQEQADRRIPILLDTPAAMRFVSVEPMLGPVDLRLPMVSAAAEREPGDVLYPFLHGLDWVICGPENGPGKRPFDMEWARSLRGQCTMAGVPFWFKGGEIDGEEWKQRPEVVGS